MHVILDLKLELLRMTRPLVRDAVWNNLYLDLKDSGQTRNILVKKISDNYYEVVDGNKRLGAAFALGWKTIRCELVT